MRVLVVGSGGREHALCWRLAKSPEVEALYCAPGNPGTAQCARNVPLAPGAFAELLAFAKEERIGAVVVGPEQPLCDGIQDTLAAAGVLVVGPSRKAARLEGSKVFAKEFMQRHGVPTAPSGVFADPAAAERYVREHAAARVVKADGLAAGKGVFVCASADEAAEACRRLLGGELGAAGKRVVVEERLEGEEVSVIALSDGERLTLLASSQDHKAALDGDRGPNTGGMGAYSPAPVLSSELEARVRGEILEPTVRGMAAEGTPFRGVLYAGLMIRGGDPFVLEFNCRFGDPETQPLMARLGSDLLPYLVGAAEGKLPAEPLRWEAGAALCVVLAAKGYPGAYRKGATIEGLPPNDPDAGIVVFHAGTAIDDAGRLVTAGGRVLGVTGRAEDIVGARELAYDAVRAIRWEGMHHRSDIGQRALDRVTTAGGPRG